MSAVTPLESFIDYKSKSGMQCGNYSIDVPPLKEGEQYRFHFDAVKCIGCRCCEVACNEQNNNPYQIKWRRVGEMEGGSFPDTLMLFNSMSCNHCIEPACLIGCPTNSYIKLENGIVIHDDPSCIGCQYCTWNCPYGVPTFHEERHIVTKCHMCHERLDIGQSPACVQACPSGAIEIETVNIDKWKNNTIDSEGNMPHLPDARLTYSTTRFTLPETLPDTLRKADEHHLKPAHPEFPLVFMTVMTQMSLGAFGALVLGEILSLFGYFEPNWILALAVMVPAALGLPLSALHLGRPLKAMSAMKNIKTSWLSREALALGLFTALMSVNVALHFFNVHMLIRLVFECTTLAVGIYGIHAQAMIYRIPARPSWDRISTNKKFFSTGYTGMLLVSLYLSISMQTDSLIPLLSTVLMAGVIHVFFSLESINQLQSADMPQLQKTFRLYSERFTHVQSLRNILLITGAVGLPLLSTLFVNTSSQTIVAMILGLSFILAFMSELLDRFLFYTTVVPLQMAGSFFAGVQRD